MRTDINLFPWRMCALPSDMLCDEMIKSTANEQKNTHEAHEAHETIRRTESIRKLNTQWGIAKFTTHTDATYNSQNSQKQSIFDQKFSAEKYIFCERRNGVYFLLRLNENPISVFKNRYSTD